MNEQDIQRFMDGRLSGDESRRMLDELRSSGKLGEVLFSEAASAMLDNPEMAEQYMSTGMHSNKRYHIIDEEQLPLAAEEEAPYGN